MSEEQLSELYFCFLVCLSDLAPKILKRTQTFLKLFLFLLQIAQHTSVSCESIVKKKCCSNSLWLLPAAQFCMIKITATSYKNIPDQVNCAMISFFSPPPIQFLLNYKFHQNGQNEKFVNTVINKIKKNLQIYKFFCRFTPSHLSFSPFSWDTLVLVAVNFHFLMNKVTQT